MANASLSEDSTEGRLHQAVMKLEASGGSITRAKERIVPLDVRHKTAD